MATIYPKLAKKRGGMQGLDESEEINACSIEHKLRTDKGDRDYLVMFKNETHNHPTEIEPFGGAATCLGGAIRDPLSGRSYVYHAMRVTGSGDPRESTADTMEYKLPQRKITREAAAGSPHPSHHPNHPHRHQSLHLLHRFPVPNHPPQPCPPVREPRYGFPTQERPHQVLLRLLPTFILLINGAFAVQHHNAGFYKVHDELIILLSLCRFLFYIVQNMV